MPESEPAEFSLSDSLSLSSLSFFPGKAPTNRQGPEGHLLPPATLASQDTPDGSHFGCSLKSSQLPRPYAHKKGLHATNTSSSYTLGSQLIERTFFILLWADGWAGHRQAQVPGFFSSVDDMPNRQGEI